MSQFRLLQIFYVVFGVCVLSAFGRFLGIQFVCYMVGVVGFLAAPALTWNTRGMWKTVSFPLATAWLVVWILLACWASGVSRVG